MKNILGKDGFVCAMFMTDLQKACHTMNHDFSISKLGGSSKLVRRQFYENFMVMNSGKYHFVRLGKDAENIFL